MTDIRGKLQSILDSALYSEGIFSYWNRKSESEEEDPNEYIVYTSDGDSGEDFADDIVLTKNASFTVRYYYRDTMLDSKTGREKIKLHESMILNALENEGFSVPNGTFDTGDIDGIGFGTIIFNCNYWRVV
jgi:hypothetical protein